MYTCGMCKKSVEGEVAFKNGAGSFCRECKAIIHARAAEGTRAHNAMLNGRCMWCGDKITDSNRQNLTGDSDEKRVCRECARNRDWLLKCIRFSDRPFKYVTRTEDRERPTREEREKAPQLPALAEPAHNEQEARLLRLELLLNKLTHALGV